MGIASPVGPKTPLPNYLTDGLYDLRDEVSYSVDISELKFKPAIKRIKETNIELEVARRFSIIGHPSLKAEAQGDDIIFTWSDDPLDFVIWTRGQVEHLVSVAKEALGKE